MFQVVGLLHDFVGLLHAFDLHQCSCCLGICIAGLHVQPVACCKARPGYTRWHCPELKLLDRFRFLEQRASSLKLLRERLRWHGLAVGQQAWLESAVIDQLSSQHAIYDDVAVSGCQVEAQFASQLALAIWTWSLNLQLGSTP